jgi:predicted amidophosphoribosyltransferase
VILATVLLGLVIIARLCYLGSLFVRRAIHNAVHNLLCEQCDAKLPYDDTAGEYANRCPKCGLPQSWAKERLPWED